MFEYCHGLALEEVDGGLLEDVTISNLTMGHINNAPIYLRLGARLRGPAVVGLAEILRERVAGTTAELAADAATPLAAPNQRSRGWGDGRPTSSSHTTVLSRTSTAAKP